MCCRILELKHEMMNLELLEFHYFDDILADMKLTPVSYPCHVVMPNKMKVESQPQVLVRYQWYP